MENEIKVLATLEELSEKFDMIIDLLKRIESDTGSIRSNTGYIDYVKTELEDLNSKVNKIYRKMD